jgi:hypothetical protein
MEYFREAAYKYEDALIQNLLSYLKKSEKTATFIDALNGIETFAEKLKIDRDSVVCDLDENGKKKRGRKNKEKKLRPKRNPSKYNVFIRENLNSYKESHPDVAHREAFKAVSALWKEQNPKEEINVVEKPVVKRGRGRPRKVVATEVDSE